MQIYVCIKHVPDTAAKISVVGEADFAETCKFVVNPYDEYAVEEAVRLVEKAGSGEVIVVTLGKEAALNTLRAVLAQGADRGILIKTDAQFTDSRIVSRALKGAIEQDGSPDLIFTGKQSVDSEGMQTHFRLAEAFGMPVVTNVVSFSVQHGKAVAECESGGADRIVVEMRMPCVVGATRGLNQPRYPKLPDIMRARKKPIKQLDLQNLGLDPCQPHSQLMKLEAAPERAQAKILTGSIQEAVTELVRVLNEEEKIL
jgi:electron transfer flavoprotein beta subunit